MKILVFAAFYLPLRGGYVESLHGLMKRLVGKGHRVKIVTCNTHQTFLSEIIEGVEILRLPCWNPQWLNQSYPLPQFLPTIKVFRQLAQEKFDLVSTQTRFYPTTWIGFFFARLRGLPVVHTERGAFHTSSQSFLVRFAGWLIDHTLGWLVCRFADATVGVSQAACNFAEHLGARQPVLIYNGIDIDFWSKNQSTPEAAIPQLTFVGRLVYAKGAQDLIRAFPAPNFQLNIVGDGPYRSYLERLVKNLDLESRVRFWGELAIVDIKKVFGETTVFVNPSYSEGLPRSVLEAAASGLPIVASDVGGTREILIDEDHGLLFPAGKVDQLQKKIEMLLANESLRQKIGQNVKNHIQSSFNWSLCAASAEKLFLAVAARSANG